MLFSVFNVFIFTISSSNGTRNKSRKVHTYDFKLRTVNCAQLSVFSFEFGNKGTPTGAKIRLVLISSSNCKSAEVFMQVHPERLETHQAGFNSNTFK